MRRARASARALAAVTVVLALLASILTAGAASAAVPAEARGGGGTAQTPPQCTQRNGRTPPPVCRVNVDLNDGARSFTSTVSTTSAVEYVVRGRPGGQYSLEAPDLGGESCFTSSGLDLVFTSPSGEVIDSTSLFGCGSYGPWTIPPGGSVIIRVQTTGDPLAYRFRFGRVDYEDVQARLRNGAVRLTGNITVALDGVDYVLHAPPGDQIVFDFPLSECDNRTIAQFAQVLDSAEHELGARFPGCFNAGPWTVPADGIVKVRVWDASGVIGNPGARSYDFKVELRHYQRIALPAGQESVEVTGSISRPLDGVEYVIDVSDLDRVTLNFLSDSVAGCEFGTNVLQLNVAYVIDGVSTGGGPLACGLNGRLDTAGMSTLTIQVYGLNLVEESPPTGSFRLAIGQLRFEKVAVDVRGGPVATEGDLTYGYDETHYEITATPGRLVSAFDPTKGRVGQSCDSAFPGLELELIEWLTDPTIPIVRRFCGPFGPFRVPPSGVVRFNAVTGPGRLLPPGPYRLNLAEFDYESVPVDLATGSSTMTGRVEAPMDATDYVVTGQSGEQVQLRFDSLDAPASCADPQSLPLLVEVYDSRWLLPDIRWEADVFGCEGMPPVTIGADGRQVFRVKQIGYGDSGSGSYSLTFTKVA